MWLKSSYSDIFFSQFRLQLPQIVENVKMAAFARVKTVNVFMAILEILVRNQVFQK